MVIVHVILNYQRVPGTVAQLTSLQENGQLTPSSPLCMVIIYLPWLEQATKINQIIPVSHCFRWELLHYPIILSSSYLHHMLTSTIFIRLFDCMYPIIYIISHHILTSITSITSILYISWMPIDWSKGKITGKSHMNHGKIDGFRLRFSLFCQPIDQWISMEYPQKIWPHIIQYPHFRILKISHWQNIINNA